MKQTLPFLRAMEVLADGEWHDMAAVIVAVMAHVEGPKAIRRAEAERVRSLRREGLPEDQPRKRPLERWQVQEIGARMIANETVAKNPRFQIQWEGPGGEWVDTPTQAVGQQARRRVRLDPSFVYGSGDNRRRGGGTSGPDPRESFAD